MSFAPIITPGMQRTGTALRRAAERGLWRGNDLDAYTHSCTALDRANGTILMFTRDTGHHSSGWLKNPDYERCYHLSVSFRDPQTGLSRPYDWSIARLWVELLFGPTKRFIWEESAKSERGIELEVRHYRLFCDEHWQPLKPRGEVYSTEFTERGWKSWSELHDDRMTWIMETAQ